MLASIVARTRGVKNLLASLAPNAPRRSPRLGSRRCRLHRVEFVASPSSAYSQLVASVMPLRSNALATARDSPSVSRQHFRYPASARSLRRCRVRRMCSVFTLARSLTPVAIRATARNQLGRRSQVLSVTRQPCSVATMPYCQREIGIMPDRTSKAKTRPGSASVTVHVVVQRRPPFSLRPTTPLPCEHRRLCATASPPLPRPARPVSADQ